MDVFATSTVSYKESPRLVPVSDQSARTPFRLGGDGGGGGGGGDGGGGCC